MGLHLHRDMFVLLAVYTPNDTAIWDINYWFCYRHWISFPFSVEEAPPKKYRNKYNV